MPLLGELVPKHKTKWSSVCPSYPLAEAAPVIHPSHFFVPSSHNLQFSLFKALLELNDPHLSSTSRERASRQLTHDCLFPPCPTVDREIEPMYPLACRSSRKSRTMSSFLSNMRRLPSRQAVHRWVQCNNNNTRQHYCHAIDSATPRRPKRSTLKFLQQRQRRQHLVSPRCFHDWPPSRSLLSSHAACCFSSSSSMDDGEEINERDEILNMVQHDLKTIVGQILSITDEEQQYDSATITTPPPLSSQRSTSTSLRQRYEQRLDRHQRQVSSPRMDQRYPWEKPSMMVDQNWDRTFPLHHPSNHDPLTPDSNDNHNDNHNNHNTPAEDKTDNSKSLFGIDSPLFSTQAETTFTFSHKKHDDENVILPLQEEHTTHTTESHLQEDECEFQGMNMSTFTSPSTPVNTTIMEEDSEKLTETSLDQDSTTPSSIKPSQRTEPIQNERLLATIDSLTQETNTFGALQELQDFVEEDNIYSLDDLDHDNDTHFFDFGNMDQGLQDPPLTHTNMEHSSTSSTSARLRDTHLSDVDRAWILLSTMRKEDWQLFNSDYDLMDDDSSDSYSESNNNHTHHPAEEFIEEKENDRQIDLETIHNLFPKNGETTIGASSNSSSSLFSTTDDYNMLLLRIGTDVELLDDEVYRSIVTIYQDLTTSSFFLGQKQQTTTTTTTTVEPNAKTFEIMLRILHQRLSNTSTAIKVLTEMMNFEIPTSPSILILGMQICEQEGNLPLMQLWFDYTLGDDMRTFKLPLRAMEILLRMYTRNNQVDDAMDLLEKCLVERSVDNPRVVDRLFSKAISWPSKSRSGKTRDTTHIVLQIMDILDREKDKGRHSWSSSYTPGVAVWENIAFALGRTARNDKTRWPLLRKPLWRVVDGPLIPDRSMLNLCLDYSEALQDTNLARAVILKCSRQMMKNDNDDEIKREETTTWDFLSTTTDESLTEEVNTTNEKKPLPQTPLVSIQSYYRAVKLCVASRDMKSCEDILNILGTFTDAFPKEALAEIYKLALNGYAQLGDTYSIEKRFEEMNQAKLDVTEESYGSVMHSLVQGDRHEEVKKLLEDLEAGSLLGGDEIIQPGVTCYNAMILSHLKRREFLQVREVFDKLKQVATPNAQSAQGLLMASYRLGGRTLTNAKSVVDEILADDSIRLNAGVCNLAMKYLLTDIVKAASGSTKIADLQQHVRRVGEDQPEVQVQVLNLLRSLRMAEVEQQRLPSKTLPLEKLSKRREEQWRQVLIDIVALEEKTTECGENEAK